MPVYMKEIYQSNRFQKDLKRVSKRGNDLEKIETILNFLVIDMDLPERCRPHKLSGNYAGFWECHIEPDWLLIYDFDEDSLTLRRTGTHSDLYD